MNAFGKRGLRVALRWLVVVLFLVVLVICCAELWWKAQMMSEVGPTWRGLTVGRSTADDVISILGTPSSIEEESGQSVYMYQEGRFEWAVHHVVIRSGVVERIEEDVLAYSYDVGLKQFIEQYSLPDHVMWSTKTPMERIAIFLNDGVFVSAVAGSLDEAQVTRVVYYRPRSLVRLRWDFRSEMSEVNPFPHSDIVGPKDPWFGTR